MTETDLALRLDEELAEGSPPARDWAAIGVRRGRRAVRQRHALAGAAAVAVVVALPLAASGLDVSLGPPDSVDVVAAAPPATQWPGQGDRASDAALTAAVAAYEREAPLPGTPSLLLAAEVRPGDLRVALLVDVVDGPDRVVWLQGPADDLSALFVDTNHDLPAQGAWVSAVLPPQHPTLRRSGTMDDTALALVVAAPGTRLMRVEVDGEGRAAQPLDTNAWYLDVPASKGQKVSLSFASGGGVITGRPHVAANYNDGDSEDHGGRASCPGSPVFAEPIDPGVIVEPICE